MIPLNAEIIRWVGLALAIVLLVSFFIVYFRFCDKVAKYAQEKGLSYWIFYILSIILTPFISYFIAKILYVEEDEEDEENEEK